MRPYSRVYASVNLDAAAENMRAMRESLPPGTAMMGVVKADGYGHGAVPIAKTIDRYAAGYGTATRHHKAYFGSGAGACVAV